MRRPIIVASVVGSLFAAATLALLIQSALAEGKFRCEVCVNFLGRTACREAVGPTPEAASRTAQDNACAFLASGMTQVVSCTTRSSASSTCTEE